jgi:uracil-DNA glycosylase family 4
MSPRILGVGPEPCDVMFIAEFPGKDEVRQRAPLVGRSGREFTRYLNGYIIPRTRPQVFLTNLSKQFAIDTKHFQFDQEDELLLWDEIRRVQPKLIVTMGMHATRYFLGPAVTLEMAHGIPHAPADIGPFGELADTVIIPAYNPAAALHSPNLQAVFAFDMRQVGLALRGTLPAPPRDRLGAECYLSLSDSAVGDFLSPATEALALDTEGLPGRPWGLSAAFQPYWSTVVRAGDTAGLSAVGDTANRVDAVVLHSALHDLPVLRDLGVSVPEDRIHDTMVMAYLLGIEPQGLKALAYRHAGMTHQDYADLTREADNRLAFQWLIDLHDRLPDDPKPTLPKPTAKMIERWAAGDPTLAASHAERCTAWAAYQPIEPDLWLYRAKTLIANTLIKDPEDTSRSMRQRWMDGRAREILTDEADHLGPFDADPPEPTLDDVPEDQAVHYSARDADATIRIWVPLKRAIDAYELTDVYDVDRAIIPMIDRMQTVGLLVDVEHFQSLSAMLAIEEQLNREALSAMAGRPINPNSGDQVAELLYDELKLHEKALNIRVRPTKSGSRLSTNDKILEALAPLHPLIGLIQDGREIRKLKGTYADAIPKLIRSDGRLHPNYRITRTDTGRLSANKPNVLALPKHSTRGKFIRDGFIAAPGRELGEWDLAQIEMVVFAVDSQDAIMIEEIKSGIDKHASTAGRIFKRDPAIVQAEHQAKQQPGKKQRFSAKAVNFGTLMGMTEFGLTDQMHKNGDTDWTVAQSVDVLEGWRDVYQGGWAYIRGKHAEGRRYGFVRDMWDRMRWLEGIRSGDDYIRAEAERMAQATPIQSGAQGIIKRNMRALWSQLQALRASGIWVECLLQVHDALVLEYDEGARDVVDATVRAAMTKTVILPFDVPIECSADFGRRLGEL